MSLLNKFKQLFFSEGVSAEEVVREAREKAEESSGGGAKAEKTTEKKEVKKEKGSVAKAKAQTQKLPEIARKIATMESGEQAPQTFKEKYAEAVAKAKAGAKAGSKKVKTITKREFKKQVVKPEAKQIEARAPSPTTTATPESVKVANVDAAKQQVINQIKRYVETVNKQLKVEGLDKLAKQYIERIKNAESIDMINAALTGFKNAAYTKVLNAVKSNVLQQVNEIAKQYGRKNIENAIKNVINTPTIKSMLESGNVMAAAATLVSAIVSAWQDIDPKLYDKLQNVVNYARKVLKGAKNEAEINEAVQKIASKLRQIAKQNVKYQAQREIDKMTASLPSDFRNQVSDLIKHYKDKIERAINTAEVNMILKEFSNTIKQRYLDYVKDQAGAKIADIFSKLSDESLKTKLIAHYSHELKLATDVKQINKILSEATKKAEQLLAKQKLNEIKQQVEASLPSDLKNKFNAIYKQALESIVAGKDPNKVLNEVRTKILQLQGEAQLKKLVDAVRGDKQVYSAFRDYYAIYLEKIRHAKDADKVNEILADAQHKLNQIIFEESKRRVLKQLREQLKSVDPRSPLGKTLKSYIQKVNKAETLTELNQLINEMDRELQQSAITTSAIASLGAKLKPEALTNIGVQYWLKMEGKLPQVAESLESAELKTVMGESQGTITVPREQLQQYQEEVKKQLETTYPLEIAERILQEAKERENAIEKAMLSFGAGLVGSTVGMFEPQTYISMYKFITEPGKQLEQMKEFITKQPELAVPMLAGTALGAVAMGKAISELTTPSEFLYVKEFQPLVERLGISPTRGKLFQFGRWKTVTRIPKGVELENIEALAKGLGGRLAYRLLSGAKGKIGEFVTELTPEELESVLAAAKSKIQLSPLGEPLATNVEAAKLSQNLAELLRIKDLGKLRNLLGGKVAEFFKATKPGEEITFVTKGSAWKLPFNLGVVSGESRAITEVPSAISTGGRALTELVQGAGASAVQTGLELGEVMKQLGTGLRIVTEAPELTTLTAPAIATVSLSNIKNIELPEIKPIKPSKVELPPTIKLGTKEIEVPGVKGLESKLERFEVPELHEIEIPELKIHELEGKEITTPTIPTPSIETITQTETGTGSETETKGGTGENLWTYQGGGGGQTITTPEEELEQTNKPTTTEEGEENKPIVVTPQKPEGTVTIPKPAITFEPEQAIVPPNVKVRDVLRKVPGSDISEVTVPELETFEQISTVSEVQPVSQETVEVPEEEVTEIPEYNVKVITGEVETPTIPPIPPVPPPYVKTKTPTGWRYIPLWWVFTNPHYGRRVRRREPKYVKELLLL